MIQLQRLKNKKSILKDKALFYSHEKLPALNTFFLAKADQASTSSNLNRVTFLQPPVIKIVVRQSGICPVLLKKCHYRQRKMNPEQGTAVILTGLQNDHMIHLTRPACMLLIYQHSPCYTIKQQSLHPNSLNKAQQW